MDFECEFSGDRPLPILAVDEPIYRRLPAFLIATVDKFASLPWMGPSGALLGGADRYDGNGFYGAADTERGTRLPAPLRPPDLVIQDELHLISGPLGTMAGLYEAAIEALCVRGTGGEAVRPKIVASTATVRQAQDQIQALFGRSLTQVFPAPGPDRRDSFFARTESTSKVPGRAYVGIAAQGRNPKVIMRRAWLALMGAAQKAYVEAGGRRNEENPADPYMTVLGYFNSLKELGRGPAHSRRGDPEHHQGLRRPQADWRDGWAVPGPEELLRGVGADVARLHGQGGRGPPPPGVRLPRG